MADETAMMESLPLSGAAPESRLKSAQAAHRIISKLRADDTPRSRNRARVRGMLDGNPPYSSTELKRLGQGYRTNLNFREAAAAVGARVSSFYNLVMDAETLASFSLTQSAKSLEAAKKKSRDPMDPDPIEYPEILADEYHKLLTEWDDFLFETMRSQDDMVTFGVGVTVWPDKYSWHFRTVPMQNVLLPPDAPASLDKQEIVVVKVEYRAPELYDRISDPEQASVSREMGWNTALLRKVIHTAYESVPNVDTWEDVQRRIKNDDLAETFAGPKPIPLYQIMWREFDNQVSMALCVTDASEEEFLFKAVGEYPDFSRVMALFFSGIGDGTYHSVRGLGYEIFPHCEVSNRNLCSLVDGTMIASGIVLRQKAGVAPGVPRMMRVGPFSVLPPGYDALDRGFNPNLEGILKVRDILQQSLSSNVGQFRPAMHEAPTSQRRTAREVTLASKKEASLEQTDVNFYYLQWDRLHREVFRRLMDSEYPEDSSGYDAREKFIKQCVERGVPKELLKFENWVVKSTRALGAGSPVIRDINSRELLEMTPFLDRKGKFQAIRNRVLTLAGPENLDRFLGDMDRDKIPVIDSSLARMESGLMQIGKPALAGSGEDHLAHFETHLGDFQQFAKQLEQNPEADYGRASQVLGLFIQHLAEHASFLEGNPAYAEDLKYIVDTLSELKTLLGKWTAAAKKQQADAARQQEQSQADSDKVRIEVEKEKIRTGALLQEREKKEDSLAANREVKTVHAMQLKEAVAAQKMRLEEQKANARKQGD